jgi:PAS domain S-box-containing protein
MSQAIPWRRTLGARLGGVALALLAFILVVDLAALSLLSSLEEATRRLAYSAKTTEAGFPVHRLARSYAEASGQNRGPLKEQLEKLSEEAAERLRRLREGDPDIGIPPADAALRGNLQKREVYWKQEITPALEELARKTTPAEAAPVLARLEGLDQGLRELVKEGTVLELESVQRTASRLRVFLIVVAALLLAGLALLLWWSRGVAVRAQSLLLAAERIAGGELALDAKVRGRDELAALGAALNAMTARLRETLGKETDEKTRTQAILDATADGIVTIDEKGTVRATNAAADRLFGTAGDRLVGQNVSQVVPALYQKDARYEDRDIRQGEAKVLGDESVVTGRRQDGTKIPLALRVAEMHYQGAKLFIATLRDVTKLTRAEEERKRVNEALREAVAQLSSAGAEILASTAQQAAGAQEQAAAVAQTAATVDEVAQTAEQAVERARGVGLAVQRTQEGGKAGRQTVEDSIAALGTVREQVESTARNILALAEQAQQIGDIIATVNDIAEQTNLLALNAAIEASRAGEHGRAFGVVAGEVKALADQSKKATGQVRQILGVIQKATNTAVLSTEEVTKGVEAAAKVADHAGQTIKALTEALAETAQASAQIVASANQQAIGMQQIHQAMRNIDEVARQNLAAMRQAEQAAQNLTALGERLTELASL